MQRLEAEKKTFLDQIETGFAMVATLFENLATQAFKVLDLRHSEAIVHCTTYQAALVDMQGQIATIE